MGTKVIPKRRNGIYYINDKEYTSVTKVLSDTLAKPALFYWGIKLASEFAFKDPGSDSKEVRAKVTAYVKGTQERGKYIHGLAEKMPFVEEDTVAQEYLGYYQALKSWWGKNNPETLAMEIEVHSDRLGVAGRLDRYAIINGERCLIDFKTGKDIYPQTGLQLRFYEEGLKEMGRGDVDKRMAVLLMQDGEYKERTFNDTIEDFEHVLGVYHWMKRKGE